MGAQKTALNAIAFERNLIAHLLRRTTETQSEMCTEKDIPKVGVKMQKRTKGMSPPSPKTKQRKVDFKASLLYHRVGTNYMRVCMYVCVGDVGMCCTQ